MLYILILFLPPQGGYASTCTILAIDNTTGRLGGRRVMQACGISKMSFYNRDCRVFVNWYLMGILNWINGKILIGIH